MKSPLLWLILLFPVATLLFWLLLGIHERKPLPQAAPLTNAPALATNAAPAN
jgi:hypothetical protein